MRKYAGLALVAVVVAFLSLLWVADGQGQIGLPRVGACRHDDAASQADRVRREQARALATAINRAEGLAAERTRQYQPLSTLQNLPQTPQGFRVRLHADASGYIFSIKDERDPCHYGIFSDEEGRLHESSPQVPQNAS
jgi:hypothetical protein